MRAAYDGQIPSAWCRIYKAGIYLHGTVADLFCMKLTFASACLPAWNGDRSFSVRAMLHATAADQTAM